MSRRYGVPGEHAETRTSPDDPFGALPTKPSIPHYEDEPDEETVPPSETEYDPEKGDP